MMSTSEPLEIDILINANCIRISSDSVFIDLEVSPGTARTRIKGYNRWRDRILINLHSPARKGQANSELIKFLNGLLCLENNQLKIVKGVHSEFKTVEIKGVDKKLVIERLTGIKYGQNK
jgi:uncharacterized protein (TIGR00251 family)